MHNFYNIFYFSKVNGLKEPDDKDEGKDNDDGPWIDDGTIILSPA